MIYCGGIKLNVNCESSASTFVLLGAEGKRGGPLSWVRYIFLRARPLKGPTKIPAVDWLASAEWSKQARFEFVPENDTTGSQRGNFWGGSGGVYLLRCRVGGFCANLGFHENNCLGWVNTVRANGALKNFNIFLRMPRLGLGPAIFTVVGATLVLSYMCAPARVNMGGFEEFLEPCWPFTGLAKFWNMSFF